MDSRTNASYFQFWGKTDQGDDSPVPSHHLLPFHNLDVAAVAGELLRSNPLLLDRISSLLRLERRAVLTLAVALTALHDLGKFSSRFQSLSPAVAEHLGAPQTRKQYTVRHDTIGFGVWTQLIFDRLWEGDWIGLRTLPGDRFDWDDYFQPLMKSVTGHHGRPPATEKVRDRGATLSKASKVASVSYSKDVLGLLMPTFPAAREERPSVDRAREASWLLAGLLVASDWIGSDQNSFSYRSEPVSLKRYWEEEAKPAAADALSDTGLMPATSSKETGLQSLFPEYTPTPLQQYASECPLGDGPQLFIFEDETGSGKTEGAVTIGHRIVHHGLADTFYFGLPTMATADAMYDRMGDAYQRLYQHSDEVSLVLAHSSRDLSDDFRTSLGMGSASRPRASYDESQTDRPGEAQCAAWLADSRKKALLGDIGVGTIDQALLSVLPSDHQSLRLLGLGRSVLIVDEVHAYDDYVQELLERLLTFHARQGGSAILLSATLPQSTRQSLADAFCDGAGLDPINLESTAFPLATHVGDGVEEGEMEVAVNQVHTDRAEIREGYGQNACVQPLQTKEKVVESLVEAARGGRCACWIRNTVPDAREAYQDICNHFREKEGLDASKVGLFHARFAYADRQSIESDVLRRYGKDSGPSARAGRVLISSPVIEQSLDLDFDYLASDLAPIDLLIQRLGRMLRHLRNANGERIEDGPDGRDATIGVYGPTPVDAPSADWYSSMFPRAAYVYPDVRRLWLTARILAEKGRIKAPEEVRELIEGVYGDGVDEEVPEVLESVSQEALNEQKRSRSIAQGNLLDVDQGYGAVGDEGRWRDDENAPTRLGEPTATVRLGRIENGRVRPWAEGDHPWRRSEVRIRASKLGQETRRTGKRQHLAEEAKETMADGGRWSVLVVLQKKGDRWMGRARTDQGEPVEVTYSSEVGLKTNDRNYS